MVWLFPAALAGLAAVAGPLIVHLLRRQRARRLIVPTVRFVPVLDPSVVRPRRPADGWLLVLRMAIVACAALALARPLLLTDARTAAWAGRIARVVVVDVSESAGSGAIGEPAAAELQSSNFAHRIDAGELAPALRRAAARLEASPTARREIVVLSDFQRGALQAADVDGVPEEIGIRFVRVATSDPAARRELVADPVLAAGGVLQRSARIDEGTTAATFGPGGPVLEGLRLLTAPHDVEAAASLLRTVARAGAHAPLGSQPIVVRFPGGGPMPRAGSASPDVAGWTGRAALRLLHAADAGDLPLTASAGGGALLVDVQAAPGTLAAAAALKAALDGRPDPRRLAEQEVARIPDETLRAWTRAPGAADTGAWRQSDESDGRWLWAAALVLLGLETFVRRSAAAPAREADAHAA